MLVALSYRQTIFAYPSGGGSYTVAKDNLGPMPGLVAAAALLTDYILTVSVSISGGVAAITSAYPSLVPHTVLLCIAAVVLLALVNLRGVRESGIAFSVPTYVFIAMMIAHDRPRAVSRVGWSCRCRADRNAGVAVRIRIPE